MDLKGILPGNRVDIRILQEINKEKDDNQVGSYMSSIFDIDEEDNFLFHMPTQGGKILLLPMNVRYEFIFTTNNGLFKAEGTVKERFKKDNFYLMKGVITSEITKFQRREYYRMECSIPLLFVSLDDEVGRAEKMADVNDAIKDSSNPPAVRGIGTILDLSGGGIKFTSEKELDDVNYLYLHFEGKMSEKKFNVEAVAEIVARVYNPDTKKYIYRVKFLFKDATKAQERIIRFIFEEERRIRNKKLQ